MSKVGGSLVEVCGGIGWEGMLVMVMVVCGSGMG